MNVNIDFSAEVETALRQTAAAAGKDIGSFLKQVITERLAEPEPDTESITLSPEVFAERQAALNLPARH